MHTWYKIAIGVPLPIQENKSLRNSIRGSQLWGGNKVEDIVFRGVLPTTLLVAAVFDSH
jgi:hypothetical protein